MSLFLGWGAYARDKNTSARLCAKKAGEAYVPGGHICVTLRYITYGNQINKIILYHSFSVCTLQAQLFICIPKIVHVYLSDWNSITIQLELVHDFYNTQVV